MKKDYKKGFSLAEMLIVFLLISIMLAAFAPVMTRKAKKKSDPNCPNGVKNMVAEYTVPGYYEFPMPENIIGEVKVTLVGGGGKGGNHTGSGGAAAGGGAGQYLVETTPVSELGKDSYPVFVGKGASGTTGAGNTTFNNTTANHGEDGTSATSTGAVNQAFGENVRGGAPGDVCTDSACNPNGKPGSGYTRSGLSPTGFLAGTGGGGGGYDGATGTHGAGGPGGDGYVKIEYTINCN